MLIADGHCQLFELVLTFFIRNLVANIITSLFLKSGNYRYQTNEVKLTDLSCPYKSISVIFFTTILSIP